MIHNTNNLSISDKFWIKDPAILFRHGNYYKIIPTSNMTYVQKLNSVTLLLIYLAIILLIFSNNKEIIFIPIAGIIIIILLYFYQRKKLKTKMKHAKFENFSNSGDWNLGKKQNRSLNDNFDNSIDDGNDNDENNNDDDDDCDGRMCCQAPTSENPFMNVTMADLMDNTKRPRACSLSESVETEIDDAFGEKYLPNINDPFNRKHSQRQFYTMPSTTIPNDQTAFAKFLYPLSETCKENPLHCLKYEDIRFSRHNPAIDSPEISLS